MNVPLGRLVPTMAHKFLIKRSKDSQRKAVTNLLGTVKLVVAHHRSWLLHLAIFVKRKWYSQDDRSIVPLVRVELGMLNLATFVKERKYSQKEATVVLLARVKLIVDYIPH